MKREKLFRHIRAVVLFYKKRNTLEKIAKTLSSKALYVRKALQGKPIRPYVTHLTQDFIEKARGYFDQAIAAFP